MFAIIMAMAAVSVPQYTTPQGNGHHSGDERRREETNDRSPTKPQTKGQPRREPGVEKREADGALMPGAPGTRDPEIPSRTPTSN